MSSSAVQLQWGLDRTVDNFLKIGLKFVQIAQTDNVQPFALLACDRFGVTLPICRETRQSVEREVHARTEPMRLSFVKAIIKQGGGDAIEELSKNISGLNFLAFASAIASTSGVESAAAVVHRVMECSANNKDMIPAEFHIFSILNVLQPRLVRVGFLELCYAWDSWLLQHPSTRSAAGHQYPPANCVEKLVKALRCLFRLGEDEVDSVLITTRSCTSWILAFIKWCTNMTPNICDSTGSVILAEPDSRVTLAIHSKSAQSTPTKIELFNASSTLLESFIAPTTSGHDRAPEYSGMVRVDTHAQQLLVDFQAESGLGQRAIIGALPYALKLGLRALEFYQTAESATVLRHSIQADPSESNCASSALLASVWSEKKVLHTVHAYLGPKAETIDGLKDLPLEISIVDLAIVKLWASESESGCLRCERARGGFDDFNYSSENHLNHHIVARLTHIAANILVLSLLDTDLKDVRLRYDRTFTWDNGLVSDPLELWEAIQKVLLGLTATPVTVEDVTAYLRRLLGHGDKHTWQNVYCIASSLQGQVLFPRVLQSMRLEQHPCLTFVVVPGILTRPEKSHGSRYRAIVSNGGEFGPVGFTSVPSDQVSGPSAFNDIAYSWKTKFEEDLIETSLSTKESLGQLVSVNPWSVLQLLPRLTFANRCLHHPDTKLPHVDQDYQFVHPQDFFNAQILPSKIIVFACRGNDALRIMIMGAVVGSSAVTIATTKIVIGQAACLGCSLDLCRRLGCYVLIC